MSILKKIDVSIIIVNYNGLDYLKDCINSLYEQFGNISFEIIIVDNNSKDNSCSYIKQNFPEIILIESKINLGFGKANNLGVQYAKADKILLLNNDTILLNPILPAITILDKNPNIGVVAINMLNGKKQYVTAVGKFPTPLRLIKISFLKDNRADFTKGEFTRNLYDVDWVSGSFMILRKVDFETIGGFDEDYFMYVEDVDLCKKMKNIGKRCVFISNLNYIHFVGFNKSRERLLLNGYQIYANKHFSLIGNMIAQVMIFINKTVKLFKKNLPKMILFGVMLTLIYYLTMV